MGHWLHLSHKWFRQILAGYIDFPPPRQTQDEVFFPHWKACIIYKGTFAYFIPNGPFLSPYSTCAVWLENGHTWCCAISVGWKLGAHLVTTPLSDAPTRPHDSRPCHHPCHHFSPLRSFGSVFFHFLFIYPGPGPVPQNPNRPNFCNTRPRTSDDEATIPASSGHKGPTTREY